MKVIDFLMIGTLCTVVGGSAFAATDERTQACIDTFVSEHIGERASDVRIEDDEYIAPMPLVLRAELPLQLTAVDRATGRTIATAACDPQEGLVDVKRE